MTPYMTDDQPQNIHDWLAGTEPPRDEYDTTPVYPAPDLCKADAAILDFLSRQSRAATLDPDAWGVDNILFVHKWKYIVHVGTGWIITEDGKAALGRYLEKQVNER